jgi:glycine/D-amino acid oxidase-like deaminating enzyme
MAPAEKNFWLETVSMPAPETTADLVDSTDVAIVGAGFTGLSAARTLAKRGVQVAVLEAETLGWGASSRNGGMVLTGMKLPVPTLIKRYGRETVHRLQLCALRAHGSGLQASALRGIRRIRGAN